MAIGSLDPRQSGTAARTPASVLCRLPALRQTAAFFIGASRRAVLDTLGNTPVNIPLGRPSGTGSTSSSGFGNTGGLVKIGQLGRAA